jgi:hypothetical protein
VRNPLLDDSEPNCAALERAVRGKELPKRVHLAELLINDPVFEGITERYPEDPWIPDTDETVEAYISQIVSLYHRLGYEFVPMFPAYHNLPDLDRLMSADGSGLPLGQRGREWIDENGGLVANWDDFEAFPWDRITPDSKRIETAAKVLPDGMKITVMATVFQQVQHSLLGVEGLSYLLYDDAELVAAVLERWRQIVLDLYSAVIDMEELDAFQSFQDPIPPIADFQRQHGDRMTAMGGVDMDKLCRYDKASLRECMRETLSECMSKGRFAFGSATQHQLRASRQLPVDGRREPSLVESLRRLSSAPLRRPVVPRVEGRDLSHARLGRTIRYDRRPTR